MPTNKFSGQKSQVERLWPHWVFTVFWVFGSGAVLFWLGLEDASANQLGDFLSGMSAPLAFYWLVVGYFLQRRELVLNREQLGLQAEELKRQAEHTGRMLSIQQTEAQRRIVDDRIAALPQKVLNLLACYSPFREVGKKLPNGSRSVRLFGHDLSADDPHQVKDNSLMILKVVERWPSRYAGDNGPIHTCFEATNASAYQQLSRQFILVNTWWTECQDLAALTESDALISKGQQYGIEELLKATAIAMNVNRAVHRGTLAPVTSKATAEVK